MCLTCLHMSAAVYQNLVKLVVFASLGVQGHLQINTSKQLWDKIDDFKNCSHENDLNKTVEWFS
jgi:hypothetical protein